MDKSSNQLVSIIIVTFGRSNVLFDTLRQLKLLTYEKKEIIVIDQNKDDLSSLISNFCVKENIMYFQNNIKSTTLARNKGIELSNGNILFFFDDDIEIHTPNHIEICLHDFEDGQVGVITGRVLQKSDLTIESISEVGIYNPLTGYQQSNWNYNEKRYVENVAGCSFCVRKSLVEKVGNFNILFAYNYYFEETEVAMRIKNIGYKILFEPDVEIFHLQAGGGARVYTELSLKFAYCYNYAILILCNYNNIVFFKFFFREVVKRFFSFIVKGFKLYKWKMFIVASRGTMQAVRDAQKNMSYVKHRKQLHSQSQILTSQLK